MRIAVLFLAFIFAAPMARAAVNAPAVVLCKATGTSAAGTTVYACNPVGPSNPLDTADQSGAAFASATTMTAGGSTVAAGRSVELLCSGAGNVSFQLGGAAHIVAVPASPYSYTLPYSVTAVNSSGTTATCTYANLY